MVPQNESTTTSIGSSYTITTQTSNVNNSTDTTRTASSTINNHNHHDAHATTTTKSSSSTITTTTTSLEVTSKTSNTTTSNSSTCCTDPYVTADIYRQCAAQLLLLSQHSNSDDDDDQQQQQQEEEDNNNSNTNYNNSINNNINANTNTINTYRVFYVNERPYIPQWRVEIVNTTTTTTIDEVDNNNNNNNNNNNDVVVESDPYISIKSVAAAIMLLQRPQQQQQQDKNNKGSSTTTSTTTTTNVVPNQTIINHIIHYLSVQRVMGGVTNTLYKVSGFLNYQKNNNNNNNNNTINNSNTNIFHIDHVLVRIFGAEGLIDRDDETGVFASLSEKLLAPAYYGRFHNGRVEGYEDGMRPLQYIELSYNNNYNNNDSNDNNNDKDKEKHSAITKGIASNLARLHYEFRILPTLSIDRQEPTLFKQLNDWYNQAIHVTFISDKEQQVINTLQLTSLRIELDWLQEQVIQLIVCDNVSNDKDNTTSNTSRNRYNLDPIVFCHNDLLAANILYNDQTQQIQLIDFEYGGINYRSFDIANHFNEYAGGPPTMSYPNYTLLPTIQQQRYFVRIYLETAISIMNSTSSSSTTTNISNKPIPHDSTTTTKNGIIHTESEQAVPMNTNLSTTTTPTNIEIDEIEIDTMMKEIEFFLLVNHLYWGLWAINQAANEGCTTYDYLTYGVQRIQQYWKQKGKKSE